MRRFSSSDFSKFFFSAPPLSLHRTQKLRFYFQKSTIIYSNNSDKNISSSKLVVDPTGDSAVQKQISDAALKKVGKISSTLPKFGQKAKEEDKQKRLEELRRRIQEAEEEENFLKSENPQQHFKDAKEELKAEEEAWASVSSKYGFALKPEFLPTYRSFHHELQKYEMNWRVLSAAEPSAIFQLEILRNDKRNNTSEVLETLTTDVNEAHSLSDMLLWSKNVLEALQFGAGVSDLKRIGSMMVPFVVNTKTPPKCVSNNKNRGKDEEDDDVSSFNHNTKFGMEGYRQQYLGEDPDTAASTKTHVTFLKLECRMHPDTPNMLLYPPTRQHQQNSAPIPSGLLSRWAVVTLERDENQNQQQNGGMRGANNNKNNNIILSVSLSTWIYMQLSSLVAVLNRNDVGVCNYELVTTLHAQKELEPTWHAMRQMAGMHPSPWPIDPRLLWHPFKK